MSSTLNFKHTTHDCTIYQTTFKGNKILLLQIVDDLLIQCEQEETAERIFFLICVALQLKNEDAPPFQYLGPCVDFNCVYIKDSNTHIMCSYQSNIDQILCTHG